MVLGVKNPLANAEDVRDSGLSPGLGRSPGRGTGIPLQYPCLENPKGRGDWWMTVHRVKKSWAQLKQLSTHASGFTSDLPVDSLHQVSSYLPSTDKPAFLSAK